MDDEGDADDQEGVARPLKSKQESAITQEADYKLWLKKIKAQSVLLDLILEMSQLGGDNGENDDDGFESVDEDADIASEEAIDLDGFDVWPMIKELFPKLVDSAKVIPLLIGVPFAAQDLMDQIGEKSLRCIAVVLFNKPKEFLTDAAGVSQIFALVHNLFEQNYLRLSES